MIGRMRRFLVVVGILILVAGAASAYYVTRHRFGDNVTGSSSGFVKTQTVPAPSPHSGIVSPMFGGVSQHLNVGIGHVHPPFHLDWRAAGNSLVEFPPAIAFHHLYYATLAGSVVAVSTENSRRLWTVHVGRCEAASPAVNTFDHGTVFETFLSRKPCGAGHENPADGLLLALAAGRSHTVRWRKQIGASETSPTIVGDRLYVGTAEGDVLALRADDGKTVWRYHVSQPVKGAIAYDRGKVFFGSYDGNLYALRAGTGKRVWPPASSARSLLGGHGHFYSTPAVAYSRVYLGSTDGSVYSFDERTGHLAWAQPTGGYVYGSPRPAQSSGRSPPTGRSPAPRRSSTASSTSPPRSPDIRTG